MLELSINPQVKDLCVATVEVEGAQIGESDRELRSFCDLVARRVAFEGLPGGEERKNAVRQLLRGGGYKPSGRNPEDPEETLWEKLPANTVYPAIFHCCGSTSFICSRSCGQMACNSRSCHLRNILMNPCQVLPGAFCQRNILRTTFLASSNRSVRLLLSPVAHSRAATASMRGLQVAMLRTDMPVNKTGGSSQSTTCFIV